MEVLTHQRTLQYSMEQVWLSVLERVLSFVRSLSRVVQGFVSVLSLVLPEPSGALAVMEVVVSDLVGR